MRMSCNTAYWARVVERMILRTLTFVGYVVGFVLVSVMLVMTVVGAAVAAVNVYDAVKGWTGL